MKAFGLVLFTKERKIMKKTDFLILLLFILTSEKLKPAFDQKKTKSPLSDLTTPTSKNVKIVNYKNTFFLGKYQYQVCRLLSVHLHASSAKCL